MSVQNFIKLSVAVHELSCAVLTDRKTAAMLKTILQCPCFDSSMEQLRHVLDGQLYADSRRHWSSTSALCHSAQVDRTALPTERVRSSAFCCCGSVDLELAACQPSWPRAESQHFQASTEDILLYQAWTTKRTKRIGNLFEYALYKFTLYLLTYLML